MRTQKDIIYTIIELQNIIIYDENTHILHSAEDLQISTNGDAIQITIPIGETFNET